MHLELIIDLNQFTGSVHERVAYRGMYYVPLGSEIDNLSADYHSSCHMRSLAPFIVCIRHGVVIRRANTHHSTWQMLDTHRTPLD